MSSNKIFLQNKLTELNNLHFNMLHKLNRISVSGVKENSEIQNMFDQLFLLNNELKARSDKNVTDLGRKDNVINHYRENISKKSETLTHLSTQNNAMPVRHSEFRSIVNDTYVSIALLTAGVIVILGLIYYLEFEREDSVTILKKQKLLGRQIKKVEPKTKPKASRSKTSTKPKNPTPSAPVAQQLSITQLKQQQQDRLQQSKTQLVVNINGNQIKQPGQKNPLIDVSKKSKIPDLK
jgi:hypothetical protein